MAGPSSAAADVSHRRESTYPRKLDAQPSIWSRPSLGMNKLARALASPSPVRAQSPPAGPVRQAALPDARPARRPGLSKFILDKGESVLMRTWGD